MAEGKKELDKKKCFIIMPISTPEHLVENYSDGEEHFHHVLSSLFIPAVELAGLAPIPPKMAGSDIIQAEIIRNLDNTDLVLCDMSALNANVFFELGIRTALNKQVCMVKDEKVKAPFDNSIVNYEEYSSGLEGWKLDGERKKIAKHITETLVNDKDGQNPLWRHFGLSTVSKMVEPKPGTEGQYEKVEARLNTIEGLLKKQILTRKERESSEGTNELLNRITRERLKNFIVKEANKNDVEIKNLETDVNNKQMYVKVSYKDAVKNENLNIFYHNVRVESEMYGYNVIVQSEE